MEPLTNTFRALSDETRLRILNLLLRTGELCVCDIEEIIGGPQTKISRHLAYLRKSGLVSARRRGLWMLYSIAADRNQEMGRILRVVEEILAGDAQAQNDSARLVRNVKDGCCATFATVIPDQKTLFLKLNKNN